MSPVTSLMPASFHESLTALGRASAVDENCAGGGSDLVARFVALTDRLDRTPLEVTLAGQFDFGRGLPEVEVQLDGRALSDLVFGMMYSPSAAASLPDLITDVEAGDTRLVAHMAGSYGVQPLAE